jgi:hypothetical protein
LGTPDTKVYLRSERSWLGTGRIYELTYTTADAAGNVRNAVAQVRVPFLLGLHADAMQMSLAPTGTPGKAHIYWDSVPDASGYDLITGDLANVVQGADATSLGAVTVLAAGTTANDFLEPSGGPQPPAGRVYFYLIQYRFPDGTTSSYGSDSAGLPREPASCGGACP